MCSHLISSFSILSFPMFVLLMFCVPSILLSLQIWIFISCSNWISWSFNLATSWTPLVLQNILRFPSVSYSMPSDLGHVSLSIHVAFFIKYRSSLSLPFLCIMNWCLCHCMKVISACSIFLYCSALTGQLRYLHLDSCIHNVPSWCLFITFRNATEKFENNLPDSISPAFILFQNSVPYYRNY